MQIKINRDVCEKIKCEHYKTPFRWKGVLCDLIPSCKSDSYSHHGCRVPEGCGYKNLHIVTMPEESLTDEETYEWCGECEYIPEEYK